MKGIKSIIAVLCVSMGLGSCGMSNAAKGGMIGGAAGGAAGSAIGAGIGALAGGKHGAKIGAAIGAGVGVAAGGTAGALIGKKMDRAKAAAQAVENAQVTMVKDVNGLDAVKVTFDNGILFKQGKAELQTAAQASLKNFASSVLNVYTDCDVTIRGFASSEGSETTNLNLSQNRAYAVKNYLTGSCSVSNAQIKETTGLGENPEYLIRDANGNELKEASRRVEVYLYASEAMIKAANAGTLK